jgi:hypothetical protein
VTGRVRGRGKRKLEGVGRLVQDPGGPPENMGGLT